jgi:hypothetical protein
MGIIVVADKGNLALIVLMLLLLAEEMISLLLPL